MNYAFTAAARDRANALWQVAGEAWARRIFTEGAEWARDHLARQEVTDAEVEAALNAHMNAATGGRDLPLDAYGALDIEAMRAALTAAKGARA